MKTSASQGQWAPRSDDPCVSTHAASPDPPQRPMSEAERRRLLEEAERLLEETRPLLEELRKRSPVPPPAQIPEN
jgi:hypothetical protein